MKIFGFDISFVYDCVCDVYNLLTAYKSMQDKKIERLKEKVEKIEEPEIEEEEEVNE